MEKYRKWTDEATGVNPFIIADQKKFNLLYNVTTIIKSFFIFGVILIISPLIIAATFLPFLSIAFSAFLTLAGNVSQYDDNKFTNDLNKLNKKNTKIILSNFSSLIDPFYFMLKVPNVKFVVIQQNEDGENAFYLVKGIGCIIRLLTKRQPFFDLMKSQQPLTGEKSLKNLINTNISLPIVIFYEGVRTNGLGTIKISKTLTESLFELEKDYMVCKISYSPRDELFFNMVRPPLFNFWRSLGSFSKRTLKIRSQITEPSSIHNANELKKDIDGFMSNNGSKLLQTKPKDFDSFIDFYYKTQKSNYVNQSK